MSIRGPDVPKHFLAIAYCLVLPATNVLARLTGCASQIFRTCRCLLTVATSGFRHLVDLALLLLV